MSLVIIMSSFSFDLLEICQSELLFYIRSFLFLQNRFVLRIKNLEVVFNIIYSAFSSSEGPVWLDIRLVNHGLQCQLAGRKIKKKFFSR